MELLVLSTFFIVMLGLGIVYKDSITHANLSA